MWTKTPKFLCGLYIYHDWRKVSALNRNKLIEFVIEPSHEILDVDKNTNISKIYDEYMTN